MGKIAVIITHLVAETEIENLTTSAQTFKTINLTASFDEHCSCRLADEDETPEIVRPGVATLFVSFTIWDSLQAADTFQEKLKLISGIDIENYVFARWKISDNELPVLYEGFGKIWFRQNLSLSPLEEESLFPALLKTFGRGWLTDNLGPTEDPFVYDHWEIREQPSETGDSKNLSSEDSKNVSDEESVKVSFVKQPFSSNDRIENDLSSDQQLVDDETLVNAKIQNFDRMLSTYNTALEKWRTAYLKADYGRLANLTNWAQKILAMIKQQVPKQDSNASIKFLKYVQAEERKWSEAVELFSSQSEIQHEFETKQAKINHDLYMEQLRINSEISNNSVIQQADRAKISFDTNNKILAMHRDIIAKNIESYERSNENFMDALLG